MPSPPSDPHKIEGLPRRDIWLLPLISILTVLGLFVGAEVASRLIWPEQLINACRIPDPVLGFRYRPNCSSTMKASEGPWYTNNYNACGYRSDAPCGPTPAGGLRIAVIGSSLSEGYLVEYPNTIAARVGTELTEMCGVPVEVQNLGGIGYSGDLWLPRMDEALRLRPTAVLLVINPFELETAAPAETDAAAPDGTSLQKLLFEKLKESRAFAMAQHFLFRNASVYLPLYLRYGDKADFLRPPFSARWSERLQTLDRLIGALADKTHQAGGVPLMLAFVPQMAQVMLMAGHTVPPGIDPTALQTAIAAIATRNGVLFTDTSVALREKPTPERLFYEVDGHLSGEGQPVAAAYIAQSYANAPGGPFADCHARQPDSLASRP
jgi:hypothetical protein